MSLKDCHWAPKYLLSEDPRFIAQHCSVLNNHLAKMSEDALNGKYNTIMHCVTVEAFRSLQGLDEAPWMV